MNVVVLGVIGRVLIVVNSLKGSIVGVFFCFGVYGVVVVGVILVSDLIVDGFKKMDEWLLK